MSPANAESFVTSHMRANEHARLRVDFATVDWAGVTKIRRSGDIVEAHFRDGWKVCAAYLDGPDPAIPNI